MIFLDWYFYGRIAFDVNESVYWSDELIFYKKLMVGWNSIYFDFNQCASEEMHSTLLNIFRWGKCRKWQEQNKFDF